MALDAWVYGRFPFRKRRRHHYHRRHRRCIFPITFWNRHQCNDIEMQRQQQEHQQPHISFTGPSSHFGTSHPWRTRTGASPQPLPASCQPSPNRRVPYLENQESSTGLAHNVPNFPPASDIQRAPQSFVRTLSLLDLIREAEIESRRIESIDGARHTHELLASVTERRSVGDNMRGTSSNASTSSLLNEDW